MSNSTRGIDSSKQGGADELAAMIRRYWRDHGYPEIEAKVARTLVGMKPVNGEKIPLYTFSIASNIGPQGFPPRNGVYYK